MYNLKFLILIAAFFLLNSCTDNNQKEISEKRDTINKDSKNDMLTKNPEKDDTIFNNVVLEKVIVSGNFSENLHDNLAEVFDHYISIKNELAENDSVDSRQHAYAILDIVMEASENPENRVDKKWTLLGDKLMQYRKIIENSVTLQDQREWFNKLTLSMTEAIQQYGIPDKTIYELSVSGNSGEVNKKWLTDSKESDNPYNNNNNNNSNNNLNDGSELKVIRAWEFD